VTVKLNSVLESRDNCH